ncbi:MAG: alkaline phosphatase family protein [Actinomycetota bacterium]|nr:alkaline phosphatase family protein [Actinomycetota bacterium]
MTSRSARPEVGRRRAAALTVALVVSAGCSGPRKNPISEPIQGPRAKIGSNGRISEKIAPRPGRRTDYRREERRSRPKSWFDAALTGAGDTPWSPGTNELWYGLPGYMLTVPGVETAAATVDRYDGKLDGRWMGHDIPADFLSDPGFNKTPVETLYQTKVSKVLLTNEGFGEDGVTEMFFTNYKDIDYMGHAYNFFKPEVRETIGYADAELRELVRFVNARGREEMGAGLHCGSRPGSAAPGSRRLAHRRAGAD